MISWAPLPESPCYEVSDQGTVRVAGRIVPQRDDGRGYLCCDIKIEGRRRTRKIHQLVMAAHRGPTPPGWHIDHLNHEKGDNRLENLRWRPAGENSSDCRRGSRKGAVPLCCEQKAALAVLLRAGWRTAAMARAIGASESTVRRLRRNLSDP